MQGKEIVEEPRTPKQRASKKINLAKMKSMTPQKGHGYLISVPRQRAVSDSFSTQVPEIKNFGHSKHNRLRLKANRMILDRGRIKSNLSGL